MTPFKVRHGYGASSASAAPITPFAVTQTPQIFKNMRCLDEIPNFEWMIWLERGVKSETWIWRLLRFCLLPNHSLCRNSNTTDFQKYAVFGSNSTDFEWMIWVESGVNTEIRILENHAHTKVCWKVTLTCSYQSM